MIDNYQVLYRESVEYSYLVLFYKDLENSPRTTPQTFYAFRKKNSGAIKKKDETPKLVKNIHGSEVYNKYLDSGWQDVTKLNDSIPSTIQVWLAEQVENRNKKTR